MKQTKQQIDSSKLVQFSAVVPENTRRRIRMHAADTDMTINDITAVALELYLERMKVERLGATSPIPVDEDDLPEGVIAVGIPVELEDDVSTLVRLLTAQNPDGALDQAKDLIRLILTNAANAMPPDPGRIKGK